MSKVFLKRCSLNAMLYNPIEVLKLRAQINTESCVSLKEASRTIYMEEGISGFYKGVWPMFWRDVPGWAIYFWAYEYCKSLLEV